MTTAKQRKLAPGYKARPRKKTGIRLAQQGEVKTGPKGERRVYWGWQEYHAIAPAVIAHMREHGRKGITAAVMAAQQVLPPEMRRDQASICACVAPSCRTGIVKVMEHIAGEPLASAPNLQLVPKPAATAAPAPAPAGKVTALPTAALPVSPSPVPARLAAAPAMSAELAALLAAPVSVFLPPLRAYLQEFVLAAVREPVERAVAQAVAKHEPKVPDLQSLLERLIAHERTQFLHLVRETVTEVLGGPAPGTAAPTALPQSQEQVPKPQEQAQEASAQQVKAATAPAHVEAPAKPAKEVPHTLEDQLSHAAKVGAIPAAVRKCVVAVGLHPTTQAECERFYGHAFRFVFLRPDAFNAQRDLPASADVVLLYKKRLSEELNKLTRRYGLPVRSVHNSSRAVLDALSELFEDSPVPHEVSHEGPLQHLAREQAGPTLHS